MLKDPVLDAVHVDLNHYLQHPNGQLAVALLLFPATASYLQDKGGCSR